MAPDPGSSAMMLLLRGHPLFSISEWIGHVSGSSNPTREGGVGSSSHGNCVDRNPGQVRSMRTGLIGGSLPVTEGGSQ